MLNPTKTKRYTFGRLAALVVALFLFASFAPDARAEDTTPQLSDTNTAQAINDCVNQTTNKMAAYTTTALVRNTQYWSDAFAADQRNPATNLRGNMAKKQCLSMTITFFQTVRNLISGVSAIANMILALIQSLLDQVCTYIAAAINNILASVCIPLPSLNFSLSLPSMSSTTCNGLSLLNVLRIDSNTNGSAVPAIPTLDTQSWLNVPMKRGAAQSSSKSTE